MGELINLRQARKQRLKRAAVALADANRAVHGRSKAEKAADRLVRQKAEVTLDQARLDPPTFND